MQTIEILLEIKESGIVYHMEVFADEPAFMLIKRLLKELRMPQMTMAGKKLVYLLRQASDGYILSEGSTLTAQNIKSGARLILDSYVVDGTVAELLQSDSVTGVLNAVKPVSASGPGSFIWNAQNKKSKRSGNGSRKSRITRRALLVLGGSVGIGVGYAIYHNWNVAEVMNVLKKPALNIPAVPSASPPTPLPRVTVPTPTIPTTVQQSVRVFTGHHGLVRAVVWSPDGSLLASGGDDKQVLLWRTDGTIVQKLLHQAAVQALAWSPDSQRMVTGADNQVTFFQQKDGHMLARIAPGEAGMITSLAWTPHQQMQVVAGLTNNRAIVLNTTTYQAQTTFTRHTTSVEGASWDASGLIVASCTAGGIVRVWNAADAHEVHGYYVDGLVPMVAIAFAPLGMMLAVGGNDGVVRLWNGLACLLQGKGNFGMQCKDAPQRLQAGHKSVQALAWSPDARSLAVGTMDGVLSIWSPAKQITHPIMISKQPTAIESITWSPDGKRLAVATLNTVTIWTIFG